ncbi:malonic semialdehyde reductase RutE [Candidatus Bilamarchaeum dharawalense]|uniref:Malonic semialdehyde reductase RutE n=1 Tax=Candidatus Bilamarchaeum dharawalense TaxID=2885759 RepID=A0A5E4LTN4_9ARCH|nr:malonic semialdehyde reductase RutE [Candidatus Bilamarchaeum dharawalense]
MLDFIKRRKTTYQFSDKKIQGRDIVKILEAARWAPSSKNSQPWKFIVVKNKANIEKIVSECYYNLFHTTPQLIIAVVMDTKTPVRRLESLEMELRYINMGMPVVNMCYEAQMLGIGSCILRPLGNEVEKILKIPNNKKVPIVVGFGYEDKKTKQPKRTRKELRGIVRYERYSE